MDQLPKLATYLGISVLGVLVFVSMPRSTHKTDARSAVAETRVNYFSHVPLDAKSVYVYDISTKKVLYAKNEQESLPLASLTKIMTAITAADLAPETTLITVNKDHLKTEGDSGLYSNERWVLNKLLQYTLVVSSNDGAAAVASSLGSLARSRQSDSSFDAFISAMNSKAQDLGLSTMRFANPSGLDVDETQAGAYGSAKDVALLLEVALNRYRNIFEPTRYESFEVASVDNIVHLAQNTDTLARKIPGLIAGKTGYSNLAGGNLAIIFDAGIEHPIAVVVLGSTYDGRFQDVDRLVKASIATIASGR